MEDRLLHPVAKFLREESAQDMVEYSLLLAFLALAAVTILNSAHNSIKTLWQDISNALSTAVAAAS